MGNVVTRNQWGSITATIDPNLPSPGIAIAIAAGVPQNMRRLFVNLFNNGVGALVNYRIVVFRGLLPADVTAFTTWDAANGVPANSSSALGVDVQFETVVPVGTLLEENLADDNESGPIAQGGDTLVALVVPLVTGVGLPKAYISLSAYGGNANPQGTDRNFRALDRFPRQYTPQG